MKTSTLIAHCIAERDLCPGAASVAAWRESSWVRIRLAGRPVPVIPLWGFKKALCAHDVHHALLRYPTNFRGECELAAWELASGGCAWNLPFWADRILTVILGACFFPAAIGRALRSGSGRRNLYGACPDDLLAADVDVLRRSMKLD